MQSRMELGFAILFYQNGGLTAARAGKRQQRSLCPEDGLALPVVHPTKNFFSRTFLRRSVPFTQKKFLLTKLPAHAEPKCAGNTFSVGFLLSQNADQNTSRNSGTNNAGHVRTHSMNQQEVAGIILLPNLLGNTGSHRNSRNTSRTNQRIDLSAW